MGYWYAGKWVEGDQISLSIFDPSFLFGATIFTTLRVYGQSLTDPRTLWQRHGDRLRNTVTKMGWPEPNWSSVTDGAKRVAADYPVVRITLLSDGRELILGRALPPQLAEKQQQGIKVWLAGDRRYSRSLADFKTGNYLGAWQAMQQAKQQGADEAILLNENGIWLETTTGNLWGFTAGKWYTPPASAGDILPGVMRAHLLEQLQQSGEIVREKLWDAALVKQFEAIAYSNSVVGVIPCTEILDTNRIISFSATHPAIRKLQQLSKKFG
ncbi:MAG: aminotransferase class IV [Limnothrix sp.]